MKVWRGIFVAGVIAMAFSVAVIQPARASTVEQSVASSVAPSAIEAIRLALQSRGEQYAGDCAAARPPQDIGKFCSKLVSDRNSVTAYLTGRTFSEFDTWLFVSQSNGSWCTVAAVPLDDKLMDTSIPWPQNSLQSAPCVFPGTSAAIVGFAPGA